MVDAIDICKICLRTDVKLKEINKVLTDYHYAVTDFALFHVDSRLCPECEYLLRKSYNFNQKCIQAAKVLQLWHRNMVYGKTNKKQLSILHTQVPQLPLKVYKQDITKIYTYEEAGPSLTNEELIPETITNNAIKKEIEVDLPEEHLKTLVAVKIEDTNAFQEVLIETNNSNDAEENATELELIDEDDTGQDSINDIIADDASLSSDDEFLAAKRKRTNHELFQSPQTNQTEKRKRRISTKKHKKEAKNYCDNEKDKSEKCIITRLKKIDEDLSAIYLNWKKTSLTDLPLISLAKEDTTTKRSVAKKKLKDKEVKKGQNVRKDVVERLKGLSTDLDSIRDNCVKLINYKEGLMNPKERLRAELVSQFSSCGELKTEDGFVICKETIMNCFDRVSECLMRRLWRFVHGKPSLEARAINTLKHIQKKYQNEHQYESVFTIEYLNTKEKVAEEFEKRRSYQCYLNAKYKCESCFLGFKYEAQMENHKNSHEENAGKFACPTCGVRHRNKKSLDSHSKSHEAVYKCKLCPLVTYYRYSMMNHYHQHEGVQYRCEPCDTSFRSKSAYKTHCGLRHSGGQNACTTCGRALASARALAAHRAKHERETQPAGSPAPCAPCGLTFASQQAYLRHARTSHAESNYTMQESKDEAAPKKKPVHTCRVCNAVGSSIGWLSLHFRLEHPAVDMALQYVDKQRHLCDVCGKGYMNAYSLRDHLSVHAGVRAHACPCGARFHRAVSLAQHAATHRPPARACRACGKRFHSQSNLNNHMRGHTGDRRYKCNLCGKGFLHRNALNEHVRGVHYKMRRVRKRNDGEKGTGGGEVGTRV